MFCSFSVISISCFIFCFGTSRLYIYILEEVFCFCFFFKLWICSDNQEFNFAPLEFDSLVPHLGGNCEDKVHSHTMEFDRHFLAFNSISGPQTSHLYNSNFFFHLCNFPKRTNYRKPSTILCSHKNRFLLKST